MTQTGSPLSIFINYRRDDAGGEAGRLFDDLTREFGSEKVFMDVAGIQPGVDFRQAIDSNVAQCGVLLAVIGPQWSSITNHAGLRRLDDPNDFVRLEITAALKRNVPVIPVFVHGAFMPPAEALPEPLKDLAYRNGVELSLARWRSDVALLLPALKTYVQPSLVLPDPPRPDPRKIDPPKPISIFTRVGKPKIVAAILALLLVMYLAFVRFLPPASPPVTTGNQGTMPADNAPATTPATASVTPTQSSKPPAPLIPASSKPGESKPPALSKLPAEPPHILPHPEPHNAAVQVPTPYQVSLPYNMNAIYADGMKFKKKASMDGVGDAYHPFFKPTDSSTGTLVVHGITFRIGPVNDLDAIHGSHSRAVSIDLPAKPYATLAILGAAVHKSQSSQTFGISYGGPTPSTQTVTQGFSDWSASAQSRLPGEEVALINSYRNTSDGTSQPGTFAVYLYRIPLDPTKPLASLTLPKNDAVVILAVTAF